MLKISLNKIIKLIYGCWDVCVCCGSPGEPEKIHFLQEKKCIYF